MALWHVPFSREGPGLLLRDLRKEQASLVALADAIRTADADIVVLTKFDYDAQALALTALRDLVGDGHHHVRALPSNSGLPTWHDLDGDGRLGEPEDMHAYGLFPGQGALAILSRFPIVDHEMASFNALLWKDFADTHVTPIDVGWEDRRLSSGGHWVVPVQVTDGMRLDLLIGHAGAPVFDGPEDRNGRRNLDELRLWSQIIEERRDGALVFMANTNLDPQRGDGYRDAMETFLRDGPFQDPLPETPTAMWDRPGPMRVSYLLPSRNMAVRQARVWPLVPDQKHRLITVDILLRNRPSP
ncbi:endonuclease/exonuclease/phosphatase family protein [Marivita sp. S6314]|uniref:endonuclease/exonuclease/phosphatase family protein n=1 Tax=Marivita sp. S6314 TaxID=2926406 RepID=UPI001FF0F476|nr:endonuclease/exonuclease/phosphatase family protein [Marivita sp. S6314]MCK0151380.1 endonuclease/exonuclease/phosphatase family protein [Marivita sp. S6314]